MRPHGVAWQSEKAYRTIPKMLNPVKRSRSYLMWDLFSGLVQMFCES